MDVLAHDILAVPPPPAATPSWGAAALTAGIWLVVALALGFFGEMLVERHKFGGSLMKGLSLLSFVAFVAIVNSAFLNGLVTSAGTKAATIASNEATSHGYTTTVEGVALFIAFVAGAWYVFRSGRVGIWAAGVFAFFTIAATATGAYPWLDQAMSAWYGFVAPNLTV